MGPTDDNLESTPNPPSGGLGSPTGDAAPLPPPTPGETTNGRQHPKRKMQIAVGAVVGAITLAVAVVSILARSEATPAAGETSIVNSTVATVAVEATTTLPVSTTTAATTTTPTSTTTSTTSTSSTSSTVVMPAALTAEQHRDSVVAAFDDWFRSELIVILDENPDVLTVDVVRLDLDPDVLVVDVTSTWSSNERQADAAWELTRSLALLWVDDGSEGLFRHEGWSPAFQLSNSGTRYDCSADVMQRFADVKASRADWETECGAPPVEEPEAAEPVAPPNTAAQVAAAQQLERDIAQQAAHVASLESYAARLRTNAELDTPAYESAIAEAESYGAVQGAAALRRELDGIWAAVAAADAEVVAGRAELARLEALRQ